MGTRRLLAEAIHAAGQAWIVAGAVWRHLIRRRPNPEHTCTVPADHLFSGMLWGVSEVVGWRGGGELPSVGHDAMLLARELSHIEAIPASGADVGVDM